SGFDGSRTIRSAGYAPRKGGLGISLKVGREYMRDWTACISGGRYATDPANIVTRTPGVNPGRFALSRSRVASAATAIARARGGSATTARRGSAGKPSGAAGTANSAPR